MPYQDPKPNAFRRGQTTLSAEALNRIRDAVPRQVRGTGDATVKDYGDRTVVDSDTVQAWMPDAKNFLQQFIFITEYADYLMCIPFDIIQGPRGWGDRYPPYNLYQLYNSDDEIDISNLPIVWVAKPFALQIDAWTTPSTEPTPELQFYETTITDIGPSTSESVNSRLVSGFITVNGVQSLPFGEYQVITPPYILGEVLMAGQCMTGMLDGSKHPKPIMWADLNTGAKAWALDVNYPYNNGS